MSTKAKYTFRELLDKVGTVKVAKKPTAKTLRMSGIDVIATADIGHDGELTVYKNGFFVYSVAGKATVAAINECCEYLDEDDKAYRLDASMFENEDWTIRLAMEGEKRLKKNSDKRNGNTYSYSADDTERNDLCDPFDFTERFAERDMVERLLSRLTEKQRRIVEMRFMDGLTQEQIASQLGISQPMVIKTISKATAEIRRKIVNDR